MVNVGLFKQVGYVKVNPSLTWNTGYVKVNFFTVLLRLMNMVNMSAAMLTLI